MPVSTVQVPEGAPSALLVFAVWLVVGWIVDQLLFRFINSRTAARGWAPGRELAAGVHGLPTVAGALIGAHLALERLTLPAPWGRYTGTTIKVLAIVAGTAFAARILGRLVRAYTEREGSRLPSTTIFVNIARAVVWVLGGISLLGALGVSIAPLVTALGVGGLAVGLALQPTLENIFSGIQVLASRQIEPGDLIRLETGEEGAVLDVTWRNTTVVTPSNDVIIVPNAVLGRARITNFSTLTCEHVLIVPVLVSPHADMTRAEQVLREVAVTIAENTEAVVPDAEPTVRFAAATPAGIQVNIGIRVKTYPDRIPVRHELIKQLQPRLVAEGIEPPVAAVSPGAGPAGGPAAGR